MTTTSPSQLPIEQLASTIRAHMTRADSYSDKAEQHAKAAGIHLLEAKARCQAGEYEGGKHFTHFLTHACAVSPSRAYELIAIANGTKTLQEIRQSWRDSKQRQASARSDLQEFQETQVVDSSLEKTGNLRKPPVETTSVAPPKNKGGRPPKASPIDEELKAINRLLKTKTLDQLRTIRSLIEGI